MITKTKDLIQKNMAWFLLICLVLVFGIFSDTFLTTRNLLNIVNQNAYLLIAAMGVSLIMMSGNMDLSIGYAMSLNGVIVARLLSDLNCPAVLAVLAAILIGMVLCSINTIAAQKLHISHMFVSFATMTVYEGLAFVISNSKSIKIANSAFKSIGQGTFWNTGLTYAMAIMLLALLAISFLLNKTYFGRYVFALGGNKNATRLAGINVDRSELIISLICGGFCGLSTAVLTARVGAANATSAVGTEFTIITGLLVGGVSIRGGEGKINGCVAGVFLVAILGNGMMMLGVNTYFQYVIKGIIMLTTIGIDSYQVMNKKKEEMNLKKGKQISNAKQTGTGDH